MDQPQESLNETSIRILIVLVIATAVTLAGCATQPSGTTTSTSTTNKTAAGALLAANGVPRLDAMATFAGYTRREPPATPFARPSLGTAPAISVRDSVPATGSVPTEAEILARGERPHVPFFRVVEHRPVAHEERVSEVPTLSAPALGPSRGALVLPGLLGAGRAPARSAGGQAAARAGSRPAGAEPDPGAERLLVLLPPAVRVEPALLRAVRLRLAPGLADVGSEAAAWLHPAVAATALAFSHADAQAAGRYRQAFRAQPVRVQRLAAEQIIRHHAHRAAVVRYEERIVLAELMGRPDPEAQAFFAGVIRRLDAAAEADPALRRRMTAWARRFGGR